jgi:NADH dehydrogenase FAD-containing subunit
VAKLQLVILGPGFAGLELAARLFESLADEARVTLIAVAPVLWGHAVSAETG